MISRDGCKLRKKIQMLVYGEPFTGKSTMAAQLAFLKREDGKPARVVIIDSESAGADWVVDELIDNGVNPANVLVYYSQSASEIRGIMKKIKSHEPMLEYDEAGNETEITVKDADGEDFYCDALVLDGLSVVYMASQEALVEFSQKRARVKADAAKLNATERAVKISGANLELLDWNRLKMEGANLALDLLSLPVHFIVTCREVDELKSELDSKGNEVRVPTGKKLPEGYKGIIYNIPTAVRLFRDEDNAVCMEVVKDRTGTYAAGTIVEDPTLSSFFPVLDGNNGKKEFNLDNGMSASVAKEVALQTKEFSGEDNIKGSAEETVDAASIRKEIVALKNSLDTANKNLVKEELEKNGLPIAYKNVEDVDLLKACLEVFKKYTN